MTRTPCRRSSIEVCRPRSGRSVMVEGKYVCADAVHESHPVLLLVVLNVRDVQPKSSGDLGPSSVRRVLAVPGDDRPVVGIERMECDDVLKDAPLNRTHSTAPSSPTPDSNRPLTMSSTTVNSRREPCWLTRRSLERLNDESTDARAVSGEVSAAGGVAAAAWAARPTAAVGARATCAEGSADVGMGGLMLALASLAPANLFRRKR